MGWFFSAETANLVGWITWGRPRTRARVGVPAAVLRAAHELFTVIQHAPPGGSGFIAESPHWEHRLAAVASQYRAIAGYAFEPKAVLHVLPRFEQEFADFDLFALGIAKEESDHDRLRDWVTYAGRSGNLDALFLLPDKYAGFNGDLTISAPFPALSHLPDWLAAAPGVAFWTRSERVAFAPSSEIDKFYAELVAARQHGTLRAVDDVLVKWESRRKHGPRMLHLSDLHFGRDEARDRKPYILAQVKLLAAEHQISSIAITGDLFDNPSEADAVAFREFYDTLGLLTGLEPIVVPGNHDQKLFGNLRWSLKALSTIDWRTIVIDSSSRVVFFCFDSSADADGANGRVTDVQRINVGKDFDIQRLKNREIDDYLRVALLHHHPITFPSREVSTMWRALDKLKLNREPLLKMDDGDEFMSWCAGRRIPIILHGHKHVPFLGSANVETRGGAEYTVHTVGCGTTTGTGGWPMSMNLVFWDGDRWTVRFMSDPDGRGFDDDRIAVHKIRVAGR